MKFLDKDNQIFLDGFVCQKGKVSKITGTRFASVCNKNPWSSPFQAWCEITRAAKPPFEDTIYMQAGRVIEAKIIEYLKESFGKDRVLSPTDVYGSQKMYDFFPDEEIFGGMWDALLVDKDGKPNGVFEIKTTKRVEDWLKEPPYYYLMQAFLYARLLGVDKVYMVLKVMQEGDYEHPETIEVNGDNVYLFPFSVSGYKDKLDIDYYMGVADNFWVRHVMSGISPRYDEQKDHDYLKLLHTANAEITDDISALVLKIETLSAEIAAIRAKADLETKEKQLSALQASLKASLIKQMSDTDTTITLGKWSVRKEAGRTKYDMAKMEKENPLLFTQVQAYKTTGEPIYKLVSENKKGEN